MYALYFQLKKKEKVIVPQNLVLNGWKPSDRGQLTLIQRDGEQTTGSVQQHASLGGASQMLDSFIYAGI